MTLQSLKFSELLAQKKYTKYLIETSNNEFTIKQNRKYLRKIYNEIRRRTHGHKQNIQR